MDPITAKLMSAAGAAAADPVYVDDVFATHVYEGNSSQNRTITNGIDLDGEGGLVWIKGRSVSESHRLQDTVNGITKSVNTDTANAETTDTQRVKSVSSTGFVIGDSGSVNDNNQDYCSWTFRKCPGFFDVVTYTGNSTGRNISHNLGSEPGSIWIKRLDDAESWKVYHRSLHQGGGSGATEFMSHLELESTGSQFGATKLWSPSASGGEAHTASTFYVDSHASVNANGGTFVAYIFAHDDQSFGENSNESIIKCGSYTGNSAGLSVDLGFEPQWLYIRSIDHTNCRGMLFDSMRGTVTNGNDAYVRVNGDQTEIGSFDYIEFTSEGFGSRTSYPFTNGNNLNYIYIAIRRPHKPPSAGTDVFDIRSHTSDVSGVLTSTTITADMAISLAPNSSTYNNIITTRLLEKYLQPNSNSGANSGTHWAYDEQTGIRHTDWFGAQNILDYTFKRAPGFFDVVAYAGNSTSGATVPHNLGAVPELMIIKAHNNARSWRVYDANTGASGSLRLDSSAAKDSNSAYWSTPTADNIILGTDNDTNSSSYSYIAYLFATLSGISKVGSYSGNGSNQNIDCGFTNGARFVLIKRTDSADSWHLFDTTQGINSGAESYYRLDLTAAQVTGNDYIDPLSSGFKLVSSDPGTNASGGTYIFLAIA